MHRQVKGLALAALLLCSVSGVSSAALAASKTFSWTDPNFVPCEGIGLQGSGQISVTVEYDAGGAAVRLKRLVMRTSYAFPHAPSAELTYTEADGSEDSVALSEASGAAMSPAGSSDRFLHLPSSITVASGRPIEVSLTTMFPQAGGTCVSSFEESFSLP